MTVGRFAPSPTGRMHLGNVLGAVLSWLSAKSRGGRWLLRIEDIDPARSRREYAQLLMDDLHWLGLTWDGEPVWQSRRSDIYEDYFQQLKGRELTYPCFCTRTDLLATQAPHESDGRVVYPGTCRPPGPAMSGTPAIAERPAATRLIVPASDVAFTDGHYGLQCVNLAHQVGDFIIRRKDGAWAYQLAVVIDDALMGITEVVRGRDLLLSTPQQLYIAQLLKLRSPCYIHFPLLLNDAGQRLSKRDGSLDMASMRQRMTAREIVGMAAYLVHLTPEPLPMTPQELLPLFCWEKVPCHDCTLKQLQ